MTDFDKKLAAYEYECDKRLDWEFEDEADELEADCWDSDMEERASLRGF